MRTVEEKVNELINKFGILGYSKKAYERYNFPFIWGIDSNGQIHFDIDCLEDYLMKEIEKGLSPDEIIQRDKQLQSDSIDLFYNETFH